MRLYSSKTQQQTKKYPLPHNDDSINLIRARRVNERCNDDD